MKDVKDMKDYCWVDLRRPDLFNEADFILWRNIHQVVKEMGEAITKNAMYSHIEEYLANNEGYGGGGFAYKFWFKTIEDRSTFIGKLSEIVGPVIAQRLEVSE